MVVIVAAADAERALGLLAAEGEQVWRIGSIRPRNDGEAQTVVR
jgi:phosphoribosylformylglycinamidine cyclo-ligase